MSQVPIGPITYAPGKCTRILSGPLDAPTSFCLKDAGLHVFWDAELENGFVCDDHAEEIYKWNPYSVHAVDVPPCGVTGSNFAGVLFEDGHIESWCYLEEGEKEKEQELEKVGAVAGTRLDEAS